MEKNIRVGNKSYSIASDDDYLNSIGDNFEPYMVKLFRALIDSNDVVADIGANIGLTSLLFSSLAHQVVAFEPSPSTYKILTRNIAKAGVTNVEVINLGLGQTAESLTITFAKDNRSGGYVSDKIRPETGHVTEKIQIDTLDRYFANSIGAPNFLKIDVEGFEQSVIKGGGGVFFPKNKPTVVMEMNHFCLDVLQRITVPDFLDFMRAAFPFLYAVDTDNITIVDLHNADQAYFVMYEHVVRNRFPNLVGGFDHSIKTKLDILATDECEFAKLKLFHTPIVLKPAGLIQAAFTSYIIGAGEILEVEITLSNNGKEDWYGYGTHPVFLCYHLQNADGSYLIYDGMRTELRNQIVYADSSVKEIVKIVAPVKTGSFKLILTVVQEGICWFEDRGFKCATDKVTVF